MPSFHAVAEFAVGEHAPRIICGGASVALAGRPIGDVLQCEPAAIAVAGQSIGQAWSVSAATGGIALAGKAVGWSLAMSLDAAVLSLSGGGLAYAFSTGAALGMGAVAEYAVAELPPIETDKTLTAATATFALTGRPIGDVLQVAPAAYVLTGQAAVLTPALLASAAGVTLTGIDVVLTGTVQASGGTYVLAGQGVAFAADLQADAGVLALIGGDTIGVGGSRLDGGTLTLFARHTLYRYTIPHSPRWGAVAEYAVAELPPIDLYGLAARPGTIALTAGQVTLQTSLQADGAAYALAGGDAHMAMSVPTAAYGLTGQDVTTAVSTDCAPAAIALAGQNAGQAWPANAAAYLLHGQDISTALAMTAEAGSITVASPDTLLLSTKVFFADGGTINLTGLDIALSSLLGASAGSLVLTGRDADLARTYPVDGGTITLTGQSAAWSLAFGLATGTYSLLGWSIADAVGPSGDHVWLIEAQAHNGTSVVTFHLSSEGFTSLATDTSPNQTYMPRIIDPGNFERSLFSGSATRGRSSVGIGDVVVASGDPGNGDLIDDWLTYGWSGRPITIKALPVGQKSVAAASVLFRGRLDRIVSTDPLNQFEFRIADRLADLDEPLLTERFAGTTTASAATAEGNADLKGQIKQQIWGDCENVPVQPANVYDLIYLVSNSALQAIDAVYDGGVALTIDGDDADIATLRAATISAGSARTCLAEGLIRLGGTPEFDVTVDAKEGSDAAARSAAQVTKRMLVHMGETQSTYLDGAFTALDAKNAAVCRLVVADDRTALDAIQQVLDSINGWMYPSRDGVLTVGRFEAPVAAPALTFDVDRQVIGDSLNRTDSPIPVWRVTVEYGRIGMVQPSSALAGSVSAARRGFLEKEYRTVTAEDASVQTKHLNARTLTVTTALAAESDAQDEADRLLALHKVERELYDVALPLADAWAAEPGNSVGLVHDRLGMSGGKSYAVVSRVDKYVDEQVQLTVWG